MTTILSINAKLLEKELQVGGEKTKTATVEKALQEFIKRREQHRILDHFGQLDWDEEYDYKLDHIRE